MDGKSQWKSWLFLLSKYWILYWFQMKCVLSLLMLLSVSNLPVFSSAVSAGSPLPNHQLLIAHKYLLRGFKPDLGRKTKRWKVFQDFLLTNDHGSSLGKTLIYFNIAILLPLFLKDLSLLVKDPLNWSMGRGPLIQPIPLHPKLNTSWDRVLMFQGQGVSCTRLWGSELRIQQ